jgi:hypothetical protein
MTKKGIIISLMTAMLSFNCIDTYAYNVVLGYVDPKNGNDGQQKSPQQGLIVSIDDYILTIPAFEDDFILELLDEDGVVVYSVYVPAGTTQVVLPSTLSGDFELRLVEDTYYYRGYISF